MKQGSPQAVAPTPDDQLPAEHKRTVDPPPPPAEAQPVNLREALEERYLAYALSTIMGRARRTPATA